VPWGGESEGGEDKLREHADCAGAGASLILGITPVNVVQGKEKDAKASSARQVDAAVDVELDLSWSEPAGVDAVMEWYVATDKGQVLSRIAPKPYRLRDVGKKAAIPETIDVSLLGDGYYHLTVALAAASGSSESIEGHEQMLYFSKKEGRVDFMPYAEWSLESKDSEAILQAGAEDEQPELIGSEAPSAVQDSDAGPNEGEAL
jgi:hypothetical protein